MLNSQQTKKWIDSTFDLIAVMLDIVGVPYEALEKPKIEDTDEKSGRLAMYSKQIIFPWCDGDVLVGTLHSLDDMTIYSPANELKRASAYWTPSIESYGFPFDKGDITVYGTPQNFVKKVLKYYEEVKKDEHS